ncbi:MAG: insulinase family protein, partial [Verrucomicrobiota bacterium]
FQGPDKEGVRIPAREELLGWIDNRGSRTLESYDDGVGDAPLMSSIPEPGSIVEERYIESIDTYDWRLSNGARVLVKSTDFKNDEILMDAFSPGGHSLVADDEFYSAVNATGIAGLSGLGKYDAIQLGKKLAGKVASVSVSLSNGYENVRGSASPKDLETLFQLTHMKFTEPRLDEKAFQSAIDRLRSSTENRLKNPNAVFQDEVSRVMYMGHPRHKNMSEALIQEIDADLALEVYKDRFADASDFTFIFVGSIDLEELKAYVSKYLASLPNLGREEKGRFVGDYMKQGQYEVKVARNLEDKTLVSVTVYGDAEWSNENSFGLGLARDVLNIKMRESLREEASGVYGVGVRGSLSREPREVFRSGFVFTCEPGNADKLIDLAWAEIDRLKEEGPSETDLEKVRENRLRSWEKGLKENPFWSGQLSSYARQGRDFDEILAAPDRIKAYTAEQVQELARRYFDDTNRIRALLTPLEDGIN